jgi:DNA-directed RNA polymerase specialized sigma subunit
MAFVEARLIAAHGERDARACFQRELAGAGISREQWATFCVARGLECFSDVSKRQRACLELLDQSGPAIDHACNGEACSQIHQGLEALTPRQAKILMLRYGMGQPEHTLQEVGDKLGIARERVRQIQAKSEQKLEQILKRSGFRHGDADRSDLRVDDQSKEALK